MRLRAWRRQWQPAAVLAVLAALTVMTTAAEATGVAEISATSGAAVTTAASAATTTVAATTAATATTTATTATMAGTELVSHGFFTDVPLHRPAGTPQQFVLLLSGEAGGADIERRLVQSLNARGAMVAEIDLPKLYAHLEADGGSCSFADGAFENLSHYLQGYAKLPTYLTPILVGHSAGGAMAYAMLAQAKRGVFAGALSLGFCPELPLTKPLCEAEALHLRRDPDGRDGLVPGGHLNAPWTVLQGATEPAACKSPESIADFLRHTPQAERYSASAVGPTTAAPPSAAAEPPWMPQVLAAFGRMATPQTALGAPPKSLADLPIVEVPSTKAGDRFAVLLSGDGGWAGIDKGVADELAAQGVPVAGFDSLRYFWSARTPDGLAADLTRIVRYYAAHWSRAKVLLVGYSQGADVLPFAINRLPADVRSRIEMTALMGLGQKASFEFHVTNWIGSSGDRPIAPEAMRLDAASTVCIYGADEKDSLCPVIAPTHGSALPLSGGHHFGGNYDRLATLILAEAAKR